MYQIPKPLLFNPLKHHLGYIKQFTASFDKDISMLKSDLAIIGNSQMDLYHGPQKIDAILQETIRYLNTSLSINKNNYIKLINEYNGYKAFYLSDGSRWILRIGLEPGRFIHLHPARHSTNTLRITANTLKTLIVASIIGGNSFSLDELNRARTQVLGLGPIKRITPNQGIGKHLPIFCKTI